jgi:hypothetical protein
LSTKISSNILPLRNIIISFQHLSTNSALQKSRNDANGISIFDGMMGIILLILLQELKGPLTTFLSLRKNSIAIQYLS